MSNTWLTRIASSICILGTVLFMGSPGWAAAPELSGLRVEPPRLTVGSGPQTVTISVRVEDADNDLNPDKVKVRLKFVDGGTEKRILVDDGTGRFNAQVVIDTSTIQSVSIKVKAKDAQGNKAVPIRTRVEILGPDVTFGGRKFDTGDFPVSVAVADLDGDGALDLVTANGFSDDVSVLLGVGDGTFGADQRVAVGSLPFSVAVADLNGDGALDLVTANTFFDDVSVLLAKVSDGAP